MQDNKSIYYIYSLIDKNGNYFYIGKGKNDRYKFHFTPSSLSMKNYKNNKIKKIFRETGKFPEVKIIEKNLSEEIAFEKEKEYINKYGLSKNGGILTNVVMGGQGSSYVKSLEHKSKISQSLNGHLVTNECKEKIRKKLKEYYSIPSNRLKARISQLGTTRPTLRGVPISQKVKTKISTTLKGRLPSKNAIEASMKSITIINVVNGEIKKFISIKEANSYIGINKKTGGFYNILRSKKQLYINREWTIFEIDGKPFIKNVTSIRYKFIHFHNIITNERKIFSSIRKAIEYGIGSAQFLCNKTLSQSKDGWIFTGRKYPDFINHNTNI